MNEVVTVVVTYNRKKLLEEAIQALLNQSYKNQDILIIDNASTDGTYEEVVKKYEENNKNLIYLNTGSNLGGAGGFNFGLKEAVKRNYKFAWIMDDDSIPEQGALESIVKKAEKLNNKFSYISSFVKWTDGSFCKMNRVFLKELEIFNDYEKINENLLPAERATFVGCFINLEITKKVGLPIKEFFIYADDMEYTLRLSNCEKAYLDMDSVIVHKMKDNVNTAIQEVSNQRIDRYYYEFRNNCYILITNKGVIKGLYKCFRRYISSLTKIIKTKNDKKMKRIWVITKGTFVGLFFHPKIEYLN